MRPRIALLPVALLALGAVLIGCGTKYKLPTEHIQGRVVPSNGSYQMVAPWHGMGGVQDVLLTPGSGAQLFVLLNRGGSGPGSRGEVVEYRLATQAAVEGRAPMEGLFNPVSLASGGDGFGGTQNRVYVLDQGDTLISKTEIFTCVPPTCNPPVSRRYITDLSKYWHVREYKLLGGPAVSTLTDTTLGFVNGIAADAQGNVYVSGISVVVTPTNLPGQFTKVFRSAIFKYAHGPGYTQFPPANPDDPSNWVRVGAYLHTEGTGVGYINDPRGMAWSATIPAGLFVADFGNNSGQKLNDADSSGFFRMAYAGGVDAIVAPEAIAVDIYGFSYLCDTGNQRVLRFDPGGGFVQRVDIEPDDNGQQLSRPTGVAANDTVVYVADHARDELLRYERRK